MVPSVEQIRLTNFQKHSIDNTSPTQPNRLSEEEWNRPPRVKIEPTRVKYGRKRRFWVNYSTHSISVASKWMPARNFYIFQKYNHSCNQHRALTRKNPSVTGPCFCTIYNITSVGLRYIVTCTRIGLRTLVSITKGEFPLVVQTS